MGWIQLDDGYAEHPKVVGLSDEALAMEVRALCYVGRRDTDGFVPDACLHLLTRAAASAEVAAELVAAGRWERDDGRGGYWIHDYLDYNPSSEQRKAKRAAAADRIRRLRSGPGSGSGGRSPDVRANSERTSREVTRNTPRSSREVRDGSDGASSDAPSRTARSRNLPANTPRRADGASPPLHDADEARTVAELAGTGPLSSNDASGAHNGSGGRSPDVRANSERTSREVTRNTPRSSREVRGKFAFSPTPIEPTSGGSIGVRGEGVVGQPGGQSDDPTPAVPGQPGPVECEPARRALVTRMLARGEIPKHATAAELEAWHATGRLPWDDDPATSANAPQAATPDRPPAGDPLSDPEPAAEASPIPSEPEGGQS